MKTFSKTFSDWVTIFTFVIGFFLPIVLVALGFAFSWTIAIVAGIICEIGVFYFVCSLMYAIHEVRRELNIANKRIKYLESMYIKLKHEKEEQQ